MANFCVPRGLGYGDQLTLAPVALANPSPKRLNLTKHQTLNSEARIASRNFRNIVPNDPCESGEADIAKAQLLSQP